MNEIDVEGEWLVSRQVLWKVPQQLLDKSLDPKRQEEPRSKNSWAVTDASEQQRGEVVNWGGREGVGREGEREGEEDNLMVSLEI